MSVQEQHAADTSIGSPASVTTSSYPDFTSYHQQVPDHCLPSKKNHIEQNYFITNRVSRNKTLVCNATFQGSDIEKADLKTNMVLEAAHFRSKRGWFATDIASRVARTKSECEFWVVAGETEAAKNVASLAQKLLSCSSSMGDVERCHKVTARTRTKVSNRKLASTTEAYCKIAVSESNKRYQGQKKAKCYASIPKASKQIYENS